MNISHMCVAIRPMSTSQAIDLGTMMARHWYVPLWKIWVKMALPFFVLLYLCAILLSTTSSMLPMLGALLFWWGKPIYEKPMVEWLGHALFSDQLEVKKTVKKGFKETFKYGWKLLFSKRLSGKRQLLLPIIMLEQPDNKQLKKRLQELSRGQSGGLTWHTLILVHFEVFMAMSVVILIGFLMPTSLISIETYLSYLENTSLLTDIGMAVLYFVCMSVVAPFFVAGGFAVYLTKRCLLEGWDIELVFKQLASRFEQTQQNPLIGLSTNAKDNLP